MSINKNVLKKAMCAVISATVLMLSVPCVTAYADDEEVEVITSGDYAYTVLDNGTAQIYGGTADDEYGDTPVAAYTGSDEEIEIPSELDGYTVTSIGDYAFLSCGTLVSVTIPDTVTSIGEYAFQNCELLVSVTIPDSVTVIDDGAFCLCESLSEAELPDSITQIGSNAFTSCNTLVGVTIPASVASMDNSSFADCVNLQSIEVSEDNENYMSVDGVLFNKAMTQLLTYPSGKTDAEYTIPDGVTSAGDFVNNAYITKLIIPNSLTSMGDISDCQNLTEIVVDEENKNYTSEDGVLFDKEMLQLMCYPGAKEGDYTVPDGVKSIDLFAFYESSGITSVTLSDTVTSIGQFAFCGCTNLSNVTFGSGLVNLGEYAFCECESLTSVELPDGLETIQSGAFMVCTGLTTVSIPSSAIYIASGAFDECDALTDIYYDGSEDDWNNIECGEEYEFMDESAAEELAKITSSILTDAEIHFAVAADSGETLDSAGDEASVVAETEQTDSDGGLPVSVVVAIAAIFAVAVIACFVVIFLKKRK